jgi:RsfA family transcription factor
MSVVNRSDLWTPEEDKLLVNTVLEYIATGKTQLKAFERVSEVTGRTPMAVGFRWNKTLRHRNKEKIAEAKRKRMELRKKVKNSRNVTEDMTLVEHCVVPPVVTYQNSNTVTITRNGKELFRIKDGYIELSSSKIRIHGFINIDINDVGSITIS